MGHLQQAAAGVGGQGGVGAVGQQDPHHVQVVVLHSVVDRPANVQPLERETGSENKVSHVVSSREPDVAIPAPL